VRLAPKNRGDFSNDEVKILSDKNLKTSIDFSNREIQIFGILFIVFSGTIHPNLDDLHFLFKIDKYFD